ncbi:MAG TPA: ATP-binding protein [Solirubrobacteraceae bacterium]|nr:ATP-binding protein [Solirubrobacteraceae bacterium]
MLGSAALATDAVGAVHALAPVASLVNVVIGIAIAVAALLCTRGVRARMRQEEAFHRSIAEAATVRERRRIARDLHDGLAQDLAFIAAHGDQLAVEKGAEYPLAIAARRALAVSRGAIADLSAAQAPTVGHALRQVADELGERFDIEVHVRAEPRAVKAVRPEDREHMVRIVREAIVNAARHGGAKRVVVSLVPRDDELVLRVRDDGVGLGAGISQSGGGFGLVSMRERAAALGGRLAARTQAKGGTEVELVVPSGAPVRAMRGRAA